MYTSVLLLTIAQICGTLSPPPYWNRDYRLAWERAEAAQRPLAIVVNGGKNGWNGISTNGELGLEVRKLLAEKYICLYVDAAEPEGQDLAKSFKAAQLPTLILSDRSRAYVALRHSGPLESDQLVQVLQRYTTAQVATVSPPVIESQPVYYRPPAPVMPVRVFGGRACAT